MKIEMYFLILLVFISMTTSLAFAAEPIMITSSGTMDKVIFDGKWTFYSEWKPTSLNTISYKDGTLIQLRSAHQGNFIYILIDEVSNIKFNKNTDMAMICFDKNNSKVMISNENNYCFGVPLDSNNLFTLQGSSGLKETSQYMKIQNPEGLIGISNISDENDRYSDVPHASYEFRIPTDVVGRSDDYGFYLGVHDTSTNHTYSWPQEIVTDSFFKIPPPNSWGEIISPDKSLPEFPWPLFITILSFSLVILFNRKQFLPSTVN